MGVFLFFLVDGHTGLWQGTAGAQALKSSPKTLTGRLIQPAGARFKQMQMPFAFRSGDVRTRPAQQEQKFPHMKASAKSRNPIHCFSQISDQSARGKEHWQMLGPLPL